MKTRRLLIQATAELELASGRFGRAGDEEDQAWELLVHALGREPAGDEDLPAPAQRRFQRLIRRRLTGEPVELIQGWIMFGGVRMRVRPGVFIPRITSEFLAEQAIRRLRRRRRPVHVDVAAGIAPVAILSARAVPHARVWALDISRKALDQGRANARGLGLANISFRRSDLFSALPLKLKGAVDVVTMHPPYVARRDLSGLPEEIKDFEPRQTLSDGSADGLGLAGRAIIESPGWLLPGGWLLIEIMPSESRHIRTLMRRAGLTDIRSTHGDHRETRVIVCRKPRR